MDIPVGPESSITTPPAGYRTLFINTDKNNRPYFKLPDGTFEPFGGTGADSETIAAMWMKAVACALDKGFIKASEFQDIMEQGVTVSSITDDDGNTTVSVGSRTIAITSITLNQSTFSGAAAATLQITTTFAPTNATNQGLTYVTSDATKATVNSTGLITLVATGSAVITVIPNGDPSKAKTVTCTIS